jgi:hypothetical protein
LKEVIYNYLDENENYKPFSFPVCLAAADTGSAKGSCCREAGKV